MAHDVVVSFF